MYPELGDSARDEVANVRWKYVLRRSLRVNSSLSDGRRLWRKILSKNLALQSLLAVLAEASTSVGIANGKLLTVFFPLLWEGLKRTEKNASAVGAWLSEEMIEKKKNWL